jgi:hypothetical protein
MGCCGDEIKEKTRRIPDMEGLPDSAYCCMARIAHNLVCAAEHFYTGRDRQNWDHLTEAQREVLALKAKAALKAVQPDARDHYDPLFYSLVRVVTSTV